MKYFYFILINMFLVTLHAQVEKTSDLYKVLRSQDSIFFEIGFNQCNLGFVDGLVHKDFTIFDEKTGVQDRTQFFESFRKNICPAEGPRSVRKPDPLSLEVYPLSADGHIYGALVTGNHSFYSREQGKEDTFRSRAKFSSIYLLENRRWLLREVISYDHQQK